MSSDTATLGIRFWWLRHRLGHSLAVVNGPCMPILSSAQLENSPLVILVDSTSSPANDKLMIPV